MFLLRRSIRRRVLLLVLLVAVSAAGGAEAAASSPPSANPRYTGSPFVRTWLADDYGAPPENSCVLQHPRSGLIYVGNAAGVLEFDGVRWRLIPADGGAVRSLCVDRRERIWGCTGSTIFRLEPDARGELQARSMMARLPAAFRSDPATYQGVATTSGVYFRESKNLIFFGNDDGPAQVWRVAEGAAVTLRLWVIGDEPYVTVGVPVNVVFRRRGDAFERTNLNYSVLAAHAEPDGSWLLLTSSPVQRWNGTELTTLEQPLDGDRASQAVFLADGRRVFATARSGLVVYDREGRVLQKIDRLKGLPGNQVAGVATDREGGLWAATPYGIARVQLDSPYARHGPAQGVEGTVRSLARFGDALFAGGTEGVTRRESDGRFRPVPNMTGSDRELVVHESWLFELCSQLNGVQPALGLQVRELENRNYYGLVPLAGQPGWFAHGSNEGLRWAHFAGENWVSEGPLRALRGAATVLLESPAGLVWTGDRRNGVGRVDFRGGLRADAPMQTYHTAEGMPATPSAMFLLGGEIVALAAGNLVRFDAAADRFVPETRIAGLERFPIERAHASADGTVWLQGSARAGREIRHVVPANADGSAGSTTLPRWRAEPLPGEPLRHLPSTALYHDVATQTLWIAGHGALLSYDLAWQPTHPPEPPTAVVRRIETAAGELLAAGDRSSRAPHLSTLEPDQNALRISFAAPTFAADRTGVVHCEYRTRLDGLDRDWSAWSNQTARDFTNLPWRALTFHVQARDDAGRVGPEATLAFAIAPPWWATRWTWAGYGALGLLGVAGIVRLRTRALHRRAERLEATIAERTRELAHSNAQLGQRNAQLATSNAELARLNQLELDEKIAAQLAEEKARLEVLRYQLNPHFLYNSLNSIYGLLFENARDAGEMVLRLSEFCRATLTGAKDELPALGAEIDALRSYLDVEKVRWGDKLQIDFDIAPNAAPVLLPPFLLLPLVENAIKYGSQTSPGVLRLSIRAWREDSGLRIEIANTGAWLPPNPARPGSTGIGLENLRQRLRRYYPDAHTFRTDARDGWVIASLTIVDCEIRLSPSDRELAETRRA